MLALEEAFLPARYIIQLANSPAMDIIVACIYFLEDASLTVVGKHDKNLSMQTEFLSLIIRYFKEKERYGKAIFKDYPLSIGILIREVNYLLVVLC